MRKMRMRNAGVTIAIGVALLMMLCIAIPSALAAESVTINEPSGGNWSGTQTIRWAFETDNGEDPEDHENFSIHYSRTGEDPWTLIIYGLGHANTTYSWNTADAGDNTNYTINVTKTNSSDHDKNVSGTGSVFNIDATAPTVVITATGVGLGTDDYAHTQQTTLDFSGTITDATSGAKNVSVLSTAGVIASNTWTVSDATLTAGCNVVTATAYDGANNSGTDTMTVCHSPAGLAIVRLPTATPPPPAGGLLPLSIIPEEGLPDEAKKIGVIAVIAVVLFVVWRGSGSKSKPKRRRRR